MGLLPFDAFGAQLPGARLAWPHRFPTATNLGCLAVFMYAWNNKSVWKKSFVSKRF